jgi:hypothetical protein
MSDTLIAEYTTYDANISTLSYDWYWCIGQSFQGNGKKLTSAKFLVSHNYDPPASPLAYACLYLATGAVGSHVPNSITPLATSTGVDVSGWNNYPTWAWVEFFFTGANQYTLVNGTWYCIALTYLAPAADPRIYCPQDLTTKTAPGNAFTHNGASFSAIDGETPFSVYGVDVLVYIPKNKLSGGMSELTGGID